MVDDLDIFHSFLWPSTAVFKSFLTFLKRHGCWQVKEEEKENKQLKEENMMMANKTEMLKVSLI